MHLCRASSPNVALLSIQQMILPLLVATGTWVSHHPGQGYCTHLVMHILKPAEVLWTP